MAVVTELVAAFGFDIKDEDIKKIGRVEEKIKSFTEAIQKIGQGFTGGKDFLDFFGGALSRGQDIENTARAIGMSTDALQEWQYAAKASGVSADSVISDLESLHNQYFMTEKSVLSLADSLSKMSAEGAHWWGSQYGISRDTILMLRQGRDAILARQKAARDSGAITPKEELEKAAKMRRELDANKATFQKLVDTAAYRLIPVVNKFLDMFNGFMESHPERIEIIIEGITTALVGLGAANLTNGILSMMSTVSNLIGVLGKVPLKLGLVGAAAAYLYSDFQRFREGKGALIPWQAIIDGCERAKKAFADFGKEMKRVWAESPGWVKAAANGITEAIVGAFDAAWQTIQTVMGGVVTFFDWLLTDRTIEGFKEKMAAVGEIWEGFGDEKTMDMVINPKIKPANVNGIGLAKELGINKPTAADVWTNEITRTANSLPNGKQFTIENMNIFTSETAQELYNGFENIGIGVSDTGFGFTQQ